MVSENSLANLKRFSATNQPIKNGAPKGPRLTTILSKLLSAKWDFNDPKIKELLKRQGLKETIESALVLRRILNGTEGDDLAIERIFDRIDGAIKQDSKAVFNNVIVNIRELSASHA